MIIFDLLSSDDNDVLSTISVAEHKEDCEHPDNDNKAKEIHKQLLRLQLITIDGKIVDA